MKKFLTLCTALLLMGSMMMVKADTWTVAGEPAAAFGSTWAPSNTDNVMVEQSDGTYRWEKDNVNATYATFKVVKGNDWGEEYPSSNYSINFTSGSKLAITFNPNTKAVNAYNPGCYIGVHGNMNGWNTVQATASLDKETASYTFTNLTAGDYEFGMRIGANDNWTSNGSSFTRANTSRVITSGSGNCTFNADIDGDYTFTWTYATSTLTVTYPALPEKSVVFNDLASQILKGTAVTFSATATNITNPVYSYYVKPAGGSYGSAVSSYTFNADGAYVVKVSVVGDNTSEPVIAEKNVTVYSTYTFNEGTRIYVDFSAVSGDAKGVNYPKNYEEGFEYDENGAGTFKTIRFSTDVTWSTLNTFIKTAKAGWAELKFSVPAAGQNKIIVAADGASYTWGTYTPETVQVKFFAPKNVQHPWANVYAHSWDAAGDITSWPGDAVTTKDGEWYVYNVQKGASLLFHDNAGMQTNNIADIAAAACYVSTGLDETDHKEDNSKPIKVILTAQCTVDYYVSGTEALTGHDWDAANADCKLDANNQIVFHNVPAGNNHQFKITNGTWTWSLGGKGALKKGACASIARDEDLENVAFSTDHTQDITITYYPEEDSICLGAETTKSSASISAENMSVYAGKTRTIDVTYTSDATPQYEILSGSDYINIADGKITGVAAGTATVRASVAETETYLGASGEFTVTVAALTTAQVKFYAPKTWEHVYAYAWVGGDAQSAAWPGDEVTATGGWYEYDVPVGASVLFTDGVAMKTKDIADVAADACYMPISLDGSAHEADESEMIVVNLAAQCTLDYYLKNKWNGGDWSWIKMTPAEGGKYRLENVVYGGMGINYNIMAADEGAKWKAYANIKYMDGAQKKVVAAYDTINLVLDPANDTIWAEMINKDAAVYTVAGNSLALFDLGWEATHPYKYTDMTKQEDGTYLWNHGGQPATLPASWLEIKVIKDRDYENGSWPDENFTYEITQSGEYDIAIHFNPYSKAIGIDTTLVKPLNIQDLSIMGSWNGWSAATPLTMGSENDKSLITLSLEAGNYEFKLVSANNKWYGDGEAFTRGNNSNKVVQVEEGENMTINVDKTGDYLFTYIFETEQLVVSYPANVPATKIAPLNGKFTINAKGDTAVFARGNLQYNYESDEWYTAEKQYEVLGDLNLRFGDATYQGSIDMFGWSCESSDYGKQWKYRDEEFSGDFVDWGHLFDGGDTEWSTLSEAEWNYILNRTKGGKKLWTMVALSSDSLNGLAIFPDDWTAPACASEMVYEFYNLDDNANYKKNTFTFTEWEEMEAAGAVFLPLGGTRAGYYGNNWSGAEETDLSNPLSSGYCWVDNTNWMGYYWLSTVKSTTQVSTVILPGWDNNEWRAPTIWNRERRRGQSVRLVTIIPRTVVVEEGETMPASEIYANDNLIVEAGGKVSGEGALAVNNLIIKTSLGTISSEQEDKNGKSGELEPSSITATGDVWIEIELTHDAEASYGWYAFSVPFQVDALNGVYYGDTKLQNEAGYAIMSFYENKFAAGEYAWKKFRGIMQPGVLYIIAVGDSDYKTLRFKKVAGASIVASSTVPLDKSDEGDNAGWNGVGNPNLRVSHMDAYQYMQFLDHENNSFKTRQAAKTNLMVGTAFMLQRTDAASSIEIKKGGLEGEDIIALAPAREPEAIEKTIFEAKLRNAETGKIEDNLFFTAREDATTTYEAGRDVTKLSIGNAKNAQMTISAYGKQLCAADFPLVNDKASYPIEINAPAAGEYAISAPATAEADIYLTKNGMIIWNLSMNDCTLTLDKGTTEGYGLLLVKKAPQISTDLESTEYRVQSTDIQKIVIDNTIFILRGGQMYDVTGKMVK